MFSSPACRGQGKLNCTLWEKFVSGSYLIFMRFRQKCIYILSQSDVLSFYYWVWITQVVGGHRCFIINMCPIRIQKFVFLVRPQEKNNFALRHTLNRYLLLNCFTTYTGDTKHSCPKFFLGSESWIGREATKVEIFLYLSSPHS